jgi:predicted dienelactone hydrolase
MWLGSLSVGADFGLRGAKDCPVTGAKMPLVIFSHGRGGFFGQHHDTAEALADAGFIVAAINHAWGSRPADIVRLLDFVLNDWKDRAAIDPARVGFVGFSVGGATGLVLLGTMPDFAKFSRLCKETTGVCAQLHHGETPPEPIRDAYSCCCHR